ncbi:MAG: cytochrome b [Gammaproteobacteria bacterium]|nr:cytochrome b [Gammaproteobacteria bacterium]
MAVLIIGLFLLGEYMVDLSYYDAWYNSALWWHDSVGITIFLLLLIRIVWKLNSIKPKPLLTYKPFEIKIAKTAHVMFYILLIIICISGYFISTAKGQGIDFFGWFDVPAIMKLNEVQANLMSQAHEITTYILVALFILHTVAALNHHYFHKDITLIRMLKPLKPLKPKDNLK